MTSSARVSYGLFFLRVSVGLMMLTQHGLPKLLSFSERADSFADPLGLGPTFSLDLAIFAEVVCSALVIVGLWTRGAVIPLIITMLVAAFVVHGDDPIRKKELALLYAVPFVTLLLTGPGAISIDGRYGVKLQFWRKR